MRPEILLGLPATIDVVMGFYDRRILPHVIHCGMSQEVFAVYRRRLVSQARGRVLEIGVGSGLNLSLYPAAVTSVVGLDPSETLLSMAARSAHRESLRVTLVRGRAEALPIASHSIDTIVTTWTMCSVGDPHVAGQEARRVLRRSGRWLFVEHGRAPEASVRLWQGWLTPMWRRVGGGCHLNRAIPEVLAAAGFQIERVEAAYMRGPRIMTFMYEGSATP